MTSGAPWSVKGIDPKAREIAKDLARRSGMTLGEYLNQMLMDENAGITEVEPPHVAAPPIPVRTVTNPIPTRPVADSRPPKRSGDDFERVLMALEDLTDRFDAQEQAHIAATARFERAIADLRND